MNDSPKHAAFFDLDRTLLAKSSGDLYIRHLRLNGQIRLMGLVNMITASVLYRLNLLKPEGTMDKLARQYRGLEEQEMIDFGEKWFQETVKNYLYTEAVDRVKEHQRKGHIVALLTAATYYIADPTNRFLNIDHCLCTRMETEGRLLTGKIVKPICHGEGKLYYARRFCEAQGIDLGNSYFYTDSIQDLPTLKAVGYPRPVNPDRPLLRTARKYGWPVEKYNRTLGGV